MAFISHNVLYGILFTFTVVQALNPGLSSLFVCLCSDAKERTTRSFSASEVFNFTTLHLSKEDNMLYVGAREILFALNLTDISSAKHQRNVRAQRLWQYKCSYNRIPEAQYEYGCKYDTTPGVQCEYYPPSLC